MVLTLVSWEDSFRIPIHTRPPDAGLCSGDGTFGPGTDHSVGPGSFPASVAVADLNGDGRPDVAVSKGGADAVSVLLGVGGGALGPAAHLHRHSPRSTAQASGYPPAAEAPIPVRPN
jgi:hypothetical protein